MHTRPPRPHAVVTRAGAHSTWESLGLTAIQARLESLLEQAAKTEPSHGDFLLDVLTTAAESRHWRPRF